MLLFGPTAGPLSNLLFSFDLLAYDSTIEKAVVMMKDELEKAKEQVLKVL